jgi:hypothetical protein
MNISPASLCYGTHADVLTMNDPATGQPMTRTIVWADRVDDTCPACGQPAPRMIDHCPVALSPDGSPYLRVDDHTRHGCGAQLGVAWLEVSPSRPGQSPTEQDVLQASSELAVRLNATINGRRQVILARLRVDLLQALVRLAQPFAEGETSQDRAAEVSSGSMTSPGVRRHNARWEAWDYDPDGTGVILVVDQAEVIPVGDG